MHQPDLGRVDSRAYTLQRLSDILGYNFTRNHGWEPALQRYESKERSL